MKYDVVTIGDALEDIFVSPKLDSRYERSFGSGKGICFELGEKIPLEWAEHHVGGSACNVAVGLARLGLNSAVCTTLGKDAPEKRILEVLEDEAVDSDLVKINSEAKTGFSVIFSIDGNRTIFVYHSTGKIEIPRDLSTDWLFVSSLLEDSENIEKQVMTLVSEKNIKLAWNPGSHQIARKANHYKNLLRLTSILFLNKDEAIDFLNCSIKPSWEDALRRLADFGPKIIVITNGKEGVRAYDGKETYSVNAEKNAKVMDSTGAGDAFATAFLANMIEEPENIELALKRGIENSTSVIRKIGAQTGLLKSF